MLTYLCTLCRVKVWWGYYLQLQIVPYLSNLLMTINWVEQTNKQTNKQIAPGQRCRVLLARHMAQSPDQLRDSTLIYDKIFFVLFHAESSVSQGSLTQGSSVLSPFDPFLAIDRSYTTCFRSKKVRNSTNVNIPLKRKETAEEVWSKVP